jgi:hypothetical protein
MNKPSLFIPPRPKNPYEANVTGCRICGKPISWRSKFYCSRSCQIKALSLNSERVSIFNDRLRRRNNITAIRKSAHTIYDFMDRIEIYPPPSFLNKLGGCWLYTGPINTYGYGAFKNQGAHIYSYKIFVGKIPYGMQVHHECYMRNCVNPAHLKVKTNLENVHHRDFVPPRVQKMTKEELKAQHSALYVQLVQEDEYFRLLSALCECPKCGCCFYRNEPTTS